MPQYSKNKYLQSLLENIITSYETEINYNPLEIELDSKQLNTKEDIESLLHFIGENRKRLFIFKIAENPQVSNHLAVLARRYVLNKTAEDLLKNTSSEPKINPLKYALNSDSPAVRARIQIQKSILLPKPPIVQKDIHLEQSEHLEQPDLAVFPIDLPDFPELVKQLKALGIDNIHDAAIPIVKEHPYAFKDGIIPGNLPKGFYINKVKNALSYTDAPKRLPSTLAPILKKQVLLTLPSIEEATSLLPNLSKDTLSLLLQTEYSTDQKNIMFSLLSSHENEINNLLLLLNRTTEPVATVQQHEEFLIPLLCKQYLLGGESHTILLVRLLNTCLNKKINLEFLKNPEVQNALLSTRGIKNLQKLIQLPAEQKEWWNALVLQHLNYDKSSFDFNHFFEAYTQIFLPRIAEKNLTLPNPCPIHHEGHFLITLNRVLDVIEHSVNPQEQCVSLSELNWGPTGVHYAMLKKPASEHFKQVASCMELNNPEAINTDPEEIYQKIASENLELKPWLYRYIGQNWKPEIRLSDINAQLSEIEKLVLWSPAQRNQLIFILTCSFFDKAKISPIQWKETLNSCILSLQGLNTVDRSDVLQEFSRSFKFKPNLSLMQINAFMKQCIEFQTAVPDKKLKDDFIAPLVSCLEHEGIELFNILQERIQKTDPDPKINRFSLSVIGDFTSILMKNRETVPAEVIKLLAKLNESILTQDNIDQLLFLLNQILINRGELFQHVVLSTLSQINVSKSQKLPKIEQIHDLLKQLANSKEEIPVECNTFEKQQTWLNSLITEINPFPGCVLGNGDISKLNDLIVDALVDAIKKRSAVFDIQVLKKSLQENLNSFLVPQQLRDQLDLELMPLFDAADELIKLLLSDNPQFSQVIEKLQFFEEKKPLLLDATYRLLGETKGEYILSFLLTGNRKDTDQTTGKALGALLTPVHNLLVSKMKSFFDNPKNKGIAKDLDLDTCLSWMAAFNETHSLTFFFKEELIQKKVIPALNKTLKQLNTQDSEFEKSVLADAAIIDENAPADQALKAYKNKIKSIGKYLNLLIDLNGRLPQQFIKIYKQLNTGALARLNYNQKQILVNELIDKNPENLDLYLKLTTQALEEQPQADNAAIERAVNGLVDLFKLGDLEPDTKIMFFKMSMAHNLKSISPFPLSALDEFKKSNLPELTKSLIIKHIIQILGLPGTNSEHIQVLIKQTQLFLIENQAEAEHCISFLKKLCEENENQAQAALCMSLLKKLTKENTNEDLVTYPQILQGLAGFTLENRAQIVTILNSLVSAELGISLFKKVSKENPNQDLVIYPQILQELAGLNLETRTKITTILIGLANNKKDTTVNLSALLEVAKGLKRCSPGDVDQVLKLFTTTPYPTAQGLNAVLLAPDSSKLHDYCLEFDTNPFAKNGEKRDLVKHFATDRIKDALVNLQDLLQGEEFPHSLQMKLARQLTFIETLGYTDPLKPQDFTGLKGLTARSRHDLQERANKLLQDLRLNLINPEEKEATYLELLANLREIYFRTTGLFPNTTQMLVLLLALEDPSSNLLMRIRTGEGKSINTPMLSVLQWAQGGTVVQCTANPTLLGRDYENSCEPFFSFLKIKSALIQSDTPIEKFIPDGINCSTVEDMASFHLAAKLTKKEHLLKTNGPVHMVLDECDDALLDQLTLYKLVAETEQTHADNPAQWIYPLAYLFINSPGFRKTNPAWDENEDLDQFRLFLNNQIEEQFKGDIEKQNYLMAISNTQLKQLIHASCVAATLKENKHFITQAVKEKDESGHEITKKIACIPLVRSTPKAGSIFTDEVQQALQARLKTERKDQAQYIFIDPVPSVLASQSAQGLIKFFQKTLGRLLGISASPGSKAELDSLDTSLGIQAISIAPHAGDKRIDHKPIFTLNREGTIKAIHEIYDKIKLPVTDPLMKVNPREEIQTYEDHEKLIKQRKESIEAWIPTQTQPVLIVSEDFDEAQAIGNSLKIYEEQNYTIQIVTGKESPAELDEIIKKAGQVNTITVGTAMLAKGIDIKPGAHPKGLFVIQTYPDTERMTIQIPGRTARNGNPGEWLPIYQVKPPEDLLNKILYNLFPWTRQSINEHTVEVFRDKLQTQATVDRIYTQSLDEAEQVLMRQIEAWEDLLLELYPGDPKIQFELYQWREMILSELARAQDASVSESTLYENIAQFKKLVCTLWETAREEKWADKAEKAAHMSQEQSLRLKFLKQSDFTQELNIQTKLHQKSKPFTSGIKALMHQNLETVIADKAGAVLEYNKPSEQEKKNLELAQSKQILPYLIGNFCTIYPAAMKVFFPKRTSKNYSYVPEIVSKAIDKLIEQKNKVFHSTEKKEIGESIIQTFQETLSKAESKDIQGLLQQMKPLILKCTDLTKFSILEQCKMQGLIRSFSHLCVNLGLGDDPVLNDLQKDYDEEIMKKFGQYLVQEFAWAKEKSFSFQSLFQRTEAKKAATKIYSYADQLIKSPQDKDSIQKLYEALQHHHVILKDKYLFSITHSSPRTVIKNALDAIDSLNYAPHCDLDFRQKCHDKVISEHQISAFRTQLTNTSPYFFKTYDPVWEHMKNKLLRISNQSKNNPIHIIEELYEATVRFSSYDAYQPYLRQLKSMQKNLLNSMEEFDKSDGLHQDARAHLLEEKEKQIARSLRLDSKQVRIQSGSDGMKSYIELQIEDAPLQKEFTGYQSSLLSGVETERAKLRKAQQDLEENKNTLLQLSDRQVIEILPQRKRAGFEKLFRLKDLLALDWNNVNIDRSELPKEIQQKLLYLDELKLMNWKLNPVDLPRLQVILAKEPGENFTLCLEEQSRIQNSLSKIQGKLQDVEKQINKKESEISDRNQVIKAAERRMTEEDCSSIESIKLRGVIFLRQREIQSIQSEQDKIIRIKSGIQEEERECMYTLQDHNDKLDRKRIELIPSILDQIKPELASHLDKEANQQFSGIKNEFLEAEPVIEQMEKEETQKARYQTRRFFKTSELLRYEASLTREEAKIPVNIGIGEAEIELEEREESILAI